MFPSCDVQTGNERSGNAVGWLVMWGFEKCRFKRWMRSCGLRPCRGPSLYLRDEFRSFERKPERSVQLEPDTRGTFSFFAVLLWLIIVTGYRRMAIHFLSFSTEPENRAFSAVLCIRVQLMDIFHSHSSWIRCVKWLKSWSVLKNTQNIHTGE